MKTHIKSSSRRGVAHFALIWLIGCLAVGGVLMAKGLASSATRARTLHTKAIEDVEVGDYVLAKDPNDVGDATPHRVMALPRNWTERIIHVQVDGGGELQATMSHPFWVEGHGWINAKDLKPGDLLCDQSHCTSAVTKIWTENRVANTFNLTIAGVHTYYVLAGDRPILVHNLSAWDIGNYSDMISQSRLDNLDIHHYPQGQPASEVIPGYQYDDGLAVAVPHDQHMGMNGTNYTAGEFQGTPSDLIDEAKQNMQNLTDIPPDNLAALDAEARRRYLPPPCK